MIVEIKKVLRPCRGWQSGDRRAFGGHVDLMSINVGSEEEGVDV